MIQYLHYQNTKYQTIQYALYYNKFAHRDILINCINISVYANRTLLDKNDKLKLNVHAKLNSESFGFEKYDKLK